MSWKLTDEQVKALRKVKRHILAEPKRMAMATWRTIGDKETFESVGLKRPRCGTVACVGGWLGTFDKEFRSGYEVLDALYDPSSQRHHDVHDFFHDPNLMAQRPQTKAHAKAVARHIDRFIRDHS